VDGACERCPFAPDYKEECGYDRERQHAAQGPSTHSASGISHEYERLASESIGFAGLLNRPSYGTCPRPARASFQEPTFQDGHGPNTKKRDTDIAASVLGKTAPSSVDYVGGSWMLTPYKRHETCAEECALKDQSQSSALPTNTCPTQSRHVSTPRRHRCNSRRLERRAGRVAFVY